jgi:hypothetical protein
MFKISTKSRRVDIYTVYNEIKAYNSYIYKRLGILYPSGYQLLSNVPSELSQPKINTLNTQNCTAERLIAPWYKSSLPMI